MTYSSPQRQRNCGINRARMIVVALVAVVLASACTAENESNGIFGSADGEGAAGPGQAETTSQPGGRNDETRTGAVDLADDEINELLAVYENYLTLADTARTGRVTALEELTEISAPEVVTEVERWIADNDTLDPDFGAVVGYYSTPSVKAISGSNDDVIIHDCTEVELTYGGVGLIRANFVDRLISLHRTADGWFIDQIEVRHDGSIEAGPLGCVPEEHAIRVEATTERFLVELVALWANPEEKPAGMIGLADGPFLESLNIAREQMVAAGYRIDAPQEHVAIDASGTDTVAGHRTFVVSVCTHLPEGLPLRSLETGELVGGFDEGVEPGSYFYQEFLIGTSVDDTLGYLDEVVGLIDQHGDSDCGTEMTEEGS